MQAARGNVAECAYRPTAANPVEWDEPFAAPRCSGRAAGCRRIISKFWRKIDITIVFITHDIDEAIFSQRIMRPVGHPGEGCGGN